MLLLIHPDTGDVMSIHKGEGAIGRQAILDGYLPVGEKGKQAAAKFIEARKAGAL